jgi:hypothetical protein
MLRYAPIGESCNVSSPRIVNPYQSSAYAPVKEASHEEVGDACHHYLRTVYDRQGVSGLFRLMDSDMVRDIQASLRVERSGFNIQLGFEELAVLLIGAFLIVILMDH